MFCYHCAALGNPREAALRAGFPARRADQYAAELLKKRAVREEIAQYAEISRQKDAARALQGVERLAFGAVNDAVFLLLDGEEMCRDVIGTLDLYNVAEIKRPKGGGFEMKFFDRLKALELLLGHGGGGDGQASSFYEALERSARGLGGAVEDDAL